MGNSKPLALITVNLVIKCSFFFHDAIKNAMTPPITNKGQRKKSNVKE